MWSFTETGRGRRAVVTHAKRGSQEFKLNDCVSAPPYTGLISSFRKGESDSTHSVELLLFDNDAVTSRFKWTSLNDIEGLIDSNLITEALGEAPGRGEHTITLTQPISEFHSAKDLAFYISTLFMRSPKRTPRGKTRMAVYSSSSDDSDSDDPDHEEEQVPARKKKHEPPIPTLLATPKKSTPKTSPKKATTKSPRKGAESTKSPRKKKPVAPESFEADLEFKESDELIYETEEVAVDLTNGMAKALPKASVLPKTPADVAMQLLHPASDPPTHLCRDEQFDQLFVALESAIAAETGTVVYVSGTPGTGKTSTVKEVIGQLDLRVRENELNPFSFVEINGMKLAHPNAAYEHLWAVLNRGSMAASNAMTALEAVFTSKEPTSDRGVILVLLDELDQLVTKGQQLMYNFFNWPSLPNSRLIVVAVANTMDLPERMLSNKISSRVGLTRIQFSGYTHQQLSEIVWQRLEQIDAERLVEKDAVEYATRKVAGVGGDARRVLSILSQSVAECTEFPVKTSVVKDVIVKSQRNPLQQFVSTLGVVAKVLLCAVLARVRRTNAIETPLHDVLKQAKQFVLMSSHISTLQPHLLAAGNRLSNFRGAIAELVASGVLVQQAIRGEATQNVRLMVPANTLREFLTGDSILEGML